LNNGYGTCSPNHYYPSGITESGELITENGTMFSVLAVYEPLNIFG
jgi:hypothetical protein